MLAAERLAAGVGAAVPAPESVTVCGLPAALSVMVTAGCGGPVAVGVNVMVMSKFAPAARDAPLFLHGALPILAARPVMVRAALPVFESVTVCAALVVLIC